MGTVPLGTTDGAPRTFDLRVVSPGINLGLAQPLTPGMTGLAGTGRFDLHVSGTSDAPVLKGSAAIEAGAFTVPYTGMTYRNVNAAFTVVDRALTVDRFTLEDEDKHVLTVTGKFNVARWREAERVRPQVRRRRAPRAEEQDRRRRHQP